MSLARAYTLRQIRSHADDAAWFASEPRADRASIVEEFVRRSNELFDHVSAWDTHWHGQVFRDEIPFTPEGEEEVAHLSRLWLAACARTLEMAEDQSGKTIEGLDRLRLNADDARGALMDAGESSVTGRNCPEWNRKR
ncbi:hypothetical protein EP7_002322 [Isosphaeraceae bacterium EP7]